MLVRGNPLALADQKAREFLRKADPILASVMASCQRALAEIQVNSNTSFCIQLN